VGRIPQEVIDSILARVDIVEVVGRDLQLKRAGKEFKCLSPFTDEKTPSFTVIPAKQMFHCFSSGKSGNALRWMMEYHRMPFPDAVRDLAHMAGVEIPEPSADAAPEAPEFTGEQQLMLDALTATAAKWRQDLSGHLPAQTYLASRSIAPEAVAAFGIGYAPASQVSTMESLARSKEDLTALEAAGVLGRRENGILRDRFRDRLTFPIQDAKGRVRGFTARYIGPPPANPEYTPPKYLNTPETPVFDKGACLFGLWQALQASRRHDVLVVVEGAIDVVSCHAHGFRNVVAAMGTGLSPEQLRLATRYTNSLIFLYDADRAGLQASLRAAQVVAPLLGQRLSVRFARLHSPDGAKEDPDSYLRKHGAAAFQKALDGALTYTEFLCDTLAQDPSYNLHTAEGRATYAQALLDYAQKLPQGILRESFITEIGERARIPRESLISLREAPTGVATMTTQSGLSHAGYEHPARTAIHNLLMDIQYYAPFFPDVVLAEQGSEYYRMLSALVTAQREVPFDLEDTVVARAAQALTLDPQRFWDIRQDRNPALPRLEHLDAIAWVIKDCTLRRIDRAIEQIKAGRDTAPDLQAAVSGLSP
jgi:DNA primase